MLNFWENISRYPRFFFSSLFGLILILTAPFQTLFQTRLGNLILVLGFLITFLLMGLTLKNMLDI